MENNQMEGGMKNNRHGMMHWHCCSVPVLGALCWVVALISVIFAWNAGNTGGMVMGMDSASWYWTALTLGILSTASRGKRRGGCGCGCGKGGMCGHGNGCNCGGGKCC